MKKIVGLLVVLVGAVGAVSAQKIGHVYPDKVIEDLPKYQELSKEMEGFTNERRKDLAKRDSIYRIELARCNKTNLSELELQNCEESLLEHQQRLQAKTGQYEQEVQMKQQEMQQIILTILQDAIKKVGKEGGYTYIIDASSAYYVGGGNDVTNLVRKELGLTALPAEN